MFDVRDLGAAGDGLTLDTQAIQRAIDVCAARGGGTVRLPAGGYVTGAIFLRSHVTLHLEAGATLLGSEDPADYPIVRSRWEGVERETHAALIGGSGLENIAITGRGTVDGRGAAWWQRFRAGSLRYPRPRLISFADCRNVLVEGVTLTRSPSWTVNPVRCENVTIDKVTVINPPDSPNTDGINPDSCRYVHISNCHIDVGDDCIAIKAGTEAEESARRLPCENVTITKCTMAHGHGGVVIGSEMSGGVRNVVIANCIFEGTDRGIRLKSRRGRGGVVEDIRVTNVIMTGVLCPFTANLYYACGAWGDKTVSDKRPHAVTAGTPRFRRIHLSHITAREVALAAGFVYGLPEMPVEDLTLDDVAISIAAEAEPARPGQGAAAYPEMADDLEPMQRAGLFIRHARGLRLREVEITGQQGPALLLTDATEAESEGTWAVDPKVCYHPLEKGSSMEPATLVEPYPTEVVTLRDGTPVAIRAIRPDDAPRLQRGMSKLSAQTAFWRFGVPLNALTDAEARRLASVDYRRNMALVATREPQGSDELIGVARYAAVGPEEPEAEVAIVIADDYQGRGLGTLLLQRLAAYACSQGICAFVASISPANDRVVNMVKHSGLATQSRLVGPGEMQVRIPLNRPPDSETSPP